MTDIEEARLNQGIAALSLELEPERDLWPDIQSAINTNKNIIAQSQFSRFYPLAAAAVLAILVSSGMGFWSGGDLYTQQSQILVAEQNYGTPEDAYSMHAGYVQVQSDMAGNLTRELDDLSPEGRKVVEANLVKIDQALAEINKALKQDPNNMLLQKLLLSAYSENIEILGEMDAMTRTLNKRIQL